MKHRILSILILLLAAVHHNAGAQSTPYGNEWIDANKTYYKFKVGADGAMRIPRSVLDAAGLPAGVKGSNFMLYREGVEVPLLASAENMTTSDYLEFWGHKADGKFDKQLYVTPSAQPDDRVSLFTDTACYYLTWDAAGTHARYTDATTAIPATPPAALTYCMATAAIHFRNTFLAGATYDASSFFPAADFDQAEGYVDGVYDLASISSQTYTLATPNAVTAAPVAATLNAALLTQSFDHTHEAILKLNGAQVADSLIGTSESKHFSIALPATSLQASNTIQLSVASTPANGTPGINRWGSSFLEIVYPRNFDVSGLTTFSCRLPASPTAQYIEFLNYPGTQPRLYDSANRVFYNGDVSVAGKVRFYLQSSLQDRSLLLFSSNSSTPLALDKTIHFQDYGAAASQANYVIITNKALRQGNTDYVQAYAAYRGSNEGGAYATTITDVADLYDAFAYGYDIHPLAIQNYLRFATNTWTIKPQYATLIGRGILYHEYQDYRANPVSYNFPVVPTWGSPGSDAEFVCWGADKLQKMAIGRISVWNAAEIGAYLQKVKDYEAALKPALSPTAATELWKKKALHVASGDDKPQTDQLAGYLSSAAPIIQDTLTGYQVFAAQNDNGSPLPNNIPNGYVDSLINSGVQLLTYFGHASPGGFQYALNDLNSYHNGARDPFFLALGCDVAQMFALNIRKTIAEEWMLKPGGGSIAVMASDNLGYTDFLYNYLIKSYEHFSYKSYEATLGQQVKNIYNDVALNVPFTLTSPGKKTQLDNLIFTGDPALRLFSAPKPDYHIPSDELAAIPGNVSISTDSFKLRINAYNLARGLHDSVLVKVAHKAPGSSTAVTIRTYTLHNLLNTHTDYVWVPVNKITDVGLNQYFVTIDADNRYDETNESNNVGHLDLFIYSDNLIPVYPKEFAIVYQQGVTLKASTLNPFRPVGRYRMQIDTTMRFNSPLKQETLVSSPGGVIKWKPNILMQDSVVYYWRAAFDSVIAGQDTAWTSSSFIYLAQGSPGWNQSHYYQYTRDGYSNETLDSDRVFRYGQINNTLEVHNTIISGGLTATPYISDYWNGTQVQRFPLGSPSIQIGVIDSATGKWWLNDAANTAGALPPAGPIDGTWVRVFPTTTAAYRQAAMRYLDSIPAGNYVFIKDIIFHTSNPPVPAPHIDEWKADTAVYGAGNSLYHAIRYRLGFTLIDSFTSDKVFILHRKKGNNTYPVTQEIKSGANVNDELIVSVNVPSNATRGAINSTVIGPSNGWQSLKWKTYAHAAPQNDSVGVSVYGIDSLGGETLLTSTASRDTSLAFISSHQYPNIRLVWASADTITNTPPQAGYWRVLYSPVPEAALNPAAHFAWSDSLHIGQTENLSVAIENLTEIPMDSMLVRYKIIDASGNTHLLANKRYRKLPGNDTLHATLGFDPTYAGNTTLFIEANPDGDQREQYHPNNLGYLPLKVITDKSNPLLDVTFDGQHILDGDIVSSKPFIRILLKDENPYLPLNDTSLMNIALQYPDSPSYNLTPIHFDGVTAKFIPASVGPNGKNEAVVELRPTLTQDGRYYLYISGKDKSGNTSGLAQGAAALAKYEVSFEVLNKSMITNVLNYPNPFSTSTAFVFTLTGSQIPSQFKIQILTVTGKVVREITKDELGPLHIGRNITEYKWDGKDQYGQLLGNGVYMYRVATSMNGNSIDHFNGLSADNTGDGAGASVDKYFKHGWGKMYIMR